MKPGMASRFSARVYRKRWETHGQARVKGGSGTSKREIRLSIDVNTIMNVLV